MKLTSTKAVLLYVVVTIGPALLVWAVASGTCVIRGTDCLLLISLLVAGGRLTTRTVPPGCNCIISLLEGTLITHPADDAGWFVATACGGITLCWLSGRHNDWELMLVSDSEDGICMDMRTGWMARCATNAFVAFVFGTAGCGYGVAATIWLKTRTLCVEP